MPSPTGQQDTTRGTTPTGGQATGARKASKSLRVIVAEDDPEMRRLLVEGLRKDGYDVVGVADGGRLLVALARHFVGARGHDVADLVVSDVRMPVCTGMQLLEQVRAAHWRIPFILMTAFGDATTRKHAQELGAAFFDKPFEVSDLRRAVAAVLRKGS